MNPKTLLIVDDHALFRNGLKLLLENEFPGVVISEASNGREFLDMLPGMQPDTVLMDINMPDMDGAEATRIALQDRPQLSVIALSMFGDEAYYYKMIDAGVKGFVLKDSEIGEVKDAIRAVMAGENYFSRDLLVRVIKNLRLTSAEENLLSERELEILRLICQGLSNHEIAENLFISKRTVDKHRANILSKTQSRNTAHLVMNAIRHHWIEI